MCTIMTFDFATFESNKDAILQRVKQDAVSNSDGWNLIIAGKKEDDVIFLQAMKLDVIMALLSASSEFVRFWLHARKSTTKTQGISGCHGFRSYTGWFVQHNGILRSGRADKLPVDSMVISELLEFMTPNHVAEWLLAKEDYANVFMINPQEGIYHTVRCSTGSLHTDNKGNFSSNAIAGVCEMVVPSNFHSTNTFPVIKPTPAWQSHNWRGYGTAWEWEDDKDTKSWDKPTQSVVKPTAAVVVTATPTHAIPAKDDKPAVAAEDIVDLDWEDLTQSECAMLIPELNYDETVTMFYAQGWDLIGVPKDILNQVYSKKHKGWLGRLQKQSLGYYNKPTANERKKA